MPDPIVPHPSTATDSIVRVIGPVSWMTPTTTKRNPPSSNA